MAMKPQSSHRPSPAAELGCNPNTAPIGLAKSVATVPSLIVNGTGDPPGAVTVPPLSLVNVHFHIPMAVELVIVTMVTFVGLVLGAFVFQNTAAVTRPAPLGAIISQTPLGAW